MFVWGILTQSWGVLLSGLLGQLFVSDPHHHQSVGFFSVEDFNNYSIDGPDGMIYFHLMFTNFMRHWHFPINFFLYLTNCLRSIFIPYLLIISRFMSNLASTFWSCLQTGQGLWSIILRYTKFGTILAKGLYFSECEPNFFFAFQHFWNFNFENAYLHYFLKLCSIFTETAQCQ